MTNTGAVKKSLTRQRALETGRVSMRKQAWTAAYESLTSADREAALEPDDLQLLSMAAHLTGRDSESAELLSRAHQGFLGTGDNKKASRCATWLSMIFLFNGELAQAGGWLSRSRRLLEDESQCVEHGYVLMPAGLRSVRDGDMTAAYEAFLAAAHIASRLGDPA